MQEDDLKKYGIGNFCPHRAGSVGNHEEKQASHQLLTGKTFHFPFLSNERKRTFRLEINSRAESKVQFILKEWKSEKGKECSSG